MAADYLILCVVEQVNTLNVLVGPKKYKYMLHRSLGGSAKRTWYMAIIGTFSFCEVLLLVLWNTVKQATLKLVSLVSRLSCRGGE